MRYCTDFEMALLEMKDLVSLPNFIKGSVPNGRTRPPGAEGVGDEVPQPPCSLQGSGRAGGCG